MAEGGPLLGLVVAVRAPVAGPQMLRPLHATASSGVPRGWVMSSFSTGLPSVGMNSSDADKGLLNVTGSPPAARVARGLYAVPTVALTSSHRHISAG